MDRPIRLDLFTQVLQFPTDLKRDLQLEEKQREDIS